MLGEEILRERISGTSTFAFHTSSFFQTNTEMAEKLYGVAAEFAASAARQLFDLYCGIGTIGLSMAAAAPPRSGASRSSPTRSPTPRANARVNEISNARFVAGDARLGIRPLIEEAGKPDVVVDRPAARRPLGEGRRRVIECRGEADRLRLLQPDDARAERRPARRGRL